MDSSLEALVIKLERQSRERFFGKYRGLVTELGENGRLGMIRAQVHEVFGETATPWARPSVPFAGDRHGLVALPEVGDGVWIEFEAGDLNKPIWSGFWWAGGEMPEPAGTRTRVFATSEGHRLVLDDEAGEISLEHGGGPKIVLTADEIKLEAGGKSVVISGQGVSVNQGALEVK